MLDLLASIRYNMKPKKHLLSATLDLVLVSVAILSASLISWSMGFEATPSLLSKLGAQVTHPFLNLLLCCSLMAMVYLALLLSFQLYEPVWPYASVREVVLLGSSVILGSIGIGLLLWWDIGVPSQAFMISVLSGVFSFILLGGTKFAPRFRDEWKYQQIKRPHKRLLVIGADEVGVGVLRQLRKEPENGYLPVGFIDDDAQKTGRRIHGLEILGTTGDLTLVVRKFRIDEIVIAMPSAEGSRVREIMRLCQSKGCSFKIAPSIDAILAGYISINQIREVQVEDLLNRPTTEVNLAEVSQYLSGKRVMVTGAGGSIGSELCRQIVKFNPEQLLLFGRGENSLYHIQNELTSSQELGEFNPPLGCETVIGDIRDHSKVFRTIEKYRPQIIFHAAAHKHVIFMELHPDEAVKNNIIGTKNLVDAAIHHQVESFILVSSDKAVNPTSVMGASKRITEKLVQSKARHNGTKFVAVRFGNVFDSRGSALPRFRQQIAKGGPVTVTHREVTRYFMTIPESVQLLIQAGAMGNGGEIFILDMGEPIKILDLVQDLIRLSGLEVDRDIKIEFTGLAPGEKLYEELLTAEEGVTATKHQRIFVAQLEMIEQRKLLAQINELRELADQLRTEQVIQKLQEIVPTYQPNRGFIGPTDRDLSDADVIDLSRSRRLNEEVDGSHPGSGTEARF